MDRIPCGNLVATLEPRCRLGYGFPAECRGCRAYVVGQSYEEVARHTAWQTVLEGAPIHTLFSQDPPRRATG